ncbi:uncharacterized protein CcaverHIS019_0301460 [Cutaneotrichosporon cavernicola]|uniref:Uncharacterized protein n=1 Tax=Cutaneotrichosporon cavernicola TaxID=279322 RepID=A0AA48IEZ8_9TREE|nr:uncharacterized protein CcaverHIS019_0301460 [Cutaneotrichosporon cavernicola]BEI90076.1 hypothetical protein CcaverHIS019_0301460 [Cutaneotrichosporon cavernicola]
MMSSGTNSGARSASSTTQPGETLPRISEEASRPSSASTASITDDDDQMFFFQTRGPVQSSMPTFSEYLPRFIPRPPDPTKISEDLKNLNTHVVTISAMVNTISVEIYRLSEKAKKQTMDVNLVEDKMVLSKEGLNALKDQLEAQGELHENALMACVHYQEQLQMETAKLERQTAELQKETAGLKDETAELRTKLLTKLHTELRAELRAELDSLREETVKEKVRLDSVKNTAEVGETALKATVRQQEKAQKRENTELRAQLDKMREEYNEFGKRIAAVEAKVDIVPTVRNTNRGWECCIQ